MNLLDLVAFVTNAKEKVNYKIFYFFLSKNGAK
jgi:hypothetical protein